MKLIMYASIEILDQKKHLDDISNKILNSVFDLNLWQRAVKHPQFSQNCVERNPFEEKVAQKNCSKIEVYNCKDKPKIPCLYHCNNIVLEKMIEFGVNRAYKEALEENLTKIAHSIAFKAWDKPGETDFKMWTDNMKHKLYKILYAEFYHDSSFIKIYDDTPRPRDRLPRAELTSQVNYSKW